MFDRYGSKSNAVNLQRAVHFYQYVIERSQKSFSSILNSDDNHDMISAQSKLLSSALYELSELLEENEMLAKVHSNNFIQILSNVSIPESEKKNFLDVPMKSWDLLVFAADLGNEFAQYKLSLAFATGFYQNQIVPMHAMRSIILANLAALSGNHPEAMMHMGYRFSQVNIINSIQ